MTQNFLFLLAHLRILCHTYFLPQKGGGGWKIYTEPRLNIVKVAGLKTNKNQSNNIENPNLPKLPTVWPWRSPPGTAVFLS